MTTTAELVEATLRGDPFTPDQKEAISAFVAAHHERTAAIREHLVGMTHLFRVGEPSTARHFDGRLVQPGRPVLVGHGTIGRIEQVGDSWRGTYATSYVGDVRGPLRSTPEDAALDV